MVYPTEIKKAGTLLIVDDEPLLREALTEILTPLAAEIYVVPNGKEALELVKTGKIDAVITDINMPEMTGLRFLAEIRSLKFLTPVVVLTAYGDTNNIKEALRLDATDFLEKPFKTETIEEVMTKALVYGLELRKMESELEELYRNSDLPNDQIIRLKRVRANAQAMRINFSIYTKKAG